MMETIDDTRAHEIQEESVRLYRYAEKAYVKYLSTNFNLRGLKKGGSS